MENVIALYDDPDKAGAALRELLGRGFVRDNLAFSLLDPVAEDTLAAETGVSPEEGAPAGASAVMRGAGLGLLAGVGLALPAWLLMLLFPETRTLQVGGLIGIMFGALSGLGLGAMFGALSGGDNGDYVKLLQRMGVPERVAASYYDGMKNGQVMVMAREQDAARADEATQVFRATGAIDLDNSAGGNKALLTSERRPRSRDDGSGVHK